jgi:site-specific DNA recombinase
VKRAVLYLRVSTTGQVQTDYDPEGISIPAQRQACLRKAQQMDVEVIDEYVEPGRSATTIDKRPVFQAMLERIRVELDVDYVIVYNLSRLNRNRVDDAKVLMALRSYKVTLISAQENIDETPAGQLMHGILAAFNEYRSSADGADIKYKMSQKVKNGGTVGPAPLGYLNVRDKFEGREVRTVAIDPERGPFVTLAFELYASGEYTLKELSVELTTRGLLTRPTARRPSAPVSTSKLGEMLRHRYYTGVVSYQGIEYPGRHPALVSPELFEQVQLVMDSHSGAMERQRIHHHYLKGSLWCGECHARGVDSRLVIQRSVGRGGGEYFYFFCRGHQRGDCTSRYQPLAEVEAAVVRHYASVRLPEGVADRVRSGLVQAVSDETRSAVLLAAQHQAALRRLDVQEENLLDLASSGDVPKTKIRQRLAAIVVEREKLTNLVGDGRSALEAGAAVLREAVDLLEDVQELYRRASDDQRRLINQALFTRLYSYDGEITGEELAEPFHALLSLRTPRRARYARPKSPTARHSNGAPKGAGWTNRTSADLLALALAGQGSSRAAMVEVPGIEPGSSGGSTGLLRA